jgi:hypothetical protein
MRSVVNSRFVAFVPPSSGLTLAIYYTLYGLCQMKPLDGSTYATKANFWLPPPISLDIYSALYFNLCISVEMKVEALVVGVLKYSKNCFEI